MLSPTPLHGYGIARRMLEVSRNLDFGQEPLGTDDCGQLRLQDLQRDLPLVLDVIREIDRSHAALTEFGLDAVAAFEGGVQAGDGVGVSHASKMRLRSAEREQYSNTNGSPSVKIRR